MWISRERYNFDQKCAAQLEDLIEELTEQRDKAFQAENGLRKELGRMKSVTGKLVAAGAPELPDGYEYKVVPFQWSCGDTVVPLVKILSTPSPSTLVTGQGYIIRASCAAKKATIPSMVKAAREAYAIAFPETQWSDELREWLGK